MMKADYTEDMSEDVRDFLSHEGEKSVHVMNENYHFHFYLVYRDACTFRVIHFKMIGNYLNFTCFYPTPVEENKEHPAVYILLYTLSVFFILYGSIMYTGFIPLGPVFMLHAVGQLEIVKKLCLCMRITQLWTWKIKLRTW